jgi:hypothetical protein
MASLVSKFPSSGGSELGIYVRLRSASETELACRMVTTSRCASCQETLRCVQDAEFVICPSCRLISLVQWPRPDVCDLGDNKEDFEVGGG